MNEVPSADIAGMAADLARRIDQVCNRFETAWRERRAAQIEEYLAGLANPERMALLRELLAIEVYYRRHAGEQPRTEDYRDRFPELEPGWLTAAIHAESAVVRTTRPGAVALTPSGGSSLTTDRVPSCPPSLPPTPCGELPQVFGRYRIQQLLGRGGMGAVYLAQDSQLGRTVALKVPHFGNNPAPGLIQRFEREARIAATFHHPNLCPIYDFGQINGIYYLTMPFLRGEPLSSRLRREGPLAPPVAALFAAGIARAMQTAHEAGVLHRDLKPANIMVSEQAEPIVMDFGLARRSAPGDARLTGTLCLLGTPLYAAPEQIGRPGEVLGPTCDVYSLGVVLYEMLTGRPPFTGAVEDVLEQVISRDPEPPSRTVPNLEPALEAICLKAMAKVSSERFPSMSAFADALESAFPGTPAPPTRAPIGTVPATPRRSRRLLWPALLTAVGVLLLSATLLYLWRFGGQAAGPLQPGTRWSGRGEWAPPFAPSFDVSVIIQERDGDDFRGTYTVVGDMGRYQWLIAGTVRQESLQWHFTKAIEEPRPTGVVEKARVEGTVSGSTMKVLYRDDDSQARLELHLQK